ncbi:hypothetical protein M427DRAFT_55113 [Gonapodya prolifera JEL478]|uniref:Peroxiredoxin-like 2A n=1 Tax=Gonapodya prolifera (strain JEL478) TaxID=1344416 RepID=A0A139AJW5_GONPJ|nr:hypothetical protein M427DRAFT_55113 [Gonapodya prolifera JEL478]|eukprot:KXS16773.1 hypothetical protein M427DRAFT_55113 [Gonapodya prolifera JEL478]
MTTELKTVPWAQRVLSTELPPLSFLSEISLKDHLNTGRTLKAGELWNEKPCVIMVVRRPGCSLCREEALGLSEKRDELRSIGVDMFAVAHEELNTKDFNEKYWKGDLYLDTEKGFYKGIGYPKLYVSSLEDLKLPQVKENGARAEKKGVPMNYEGQGLIMGGLFVVSSSGVHYRYIEKVFGDHAPFSEIVEAAKVAVAAVDAARL